MEMIRNNRIVTAIKFFFYHNNIEPSGSDIYMLVTFCISDSNMTSFKRFGSKPVVKYAYISISADQQCHNLFWLFKTVFVLLE